MTNKTLNNVAALDKFPVLTEDEMMMTEGGIAIVKVVFWYGAAYKAGKEVGKTIYNILH